MQTQPEPSSSAETPTAAQALAATLRRQLEGRGAISNAFPRGADSDGENSDSENSDGENSDGVSAALQQVPARAGPRLLSSGYAELDAMLPRGGFPPGVLVEWLSEMEGGGAATLALLVARQAARRGGVIVVLDVCREFYVPAAEALGVDLERLVVVRGDSDDDHFWALDQSLRCPAVAVVWAPLARLERQIGTRHLRRWQLAAEQGGGLGMLLRPATVRGQPSWAEAQLLVRPLPIERSSPATWNLQVELTRGRGAMGPRQTTINLHI